MKKAIVLALVAWLAALAALWVPSYLHSDYSPQITRAIVFFLPLVFIAEAFTFHHVF